MNTGYISAFATASSLFYMGNVLLHLVLGLVLSVAFALLLKREPELRRPGSDDRWRAARAHRRVRGSLDSD